MLEIPVEPNDDAGVDPIVVDNDVVVKFNKLVVKEVMVVDVEEVA